MNVIGFDFGVRDSSVGWFTQRGIQLISDSDELSIRSRGHPRKTFFDTERMIARSHETPAIQEP
jgi:hypothetical protein